MLRAHRVDRRGPIPKLIRDTKFEQLEYEPKWNCKVRKAKRRTSVSGKKRAPAHSSAQQGKQTTGKKGGKKMAGVAGNKNGSSKSSSNSNRGAQSPRTQKRTGTTKQNMKMTKKK